MRKKAAVVQGKTNLWKQDCIGQKKEWPTKIIGGNINEVKQNFTHCFTKAICTAVRQLKLPRSIVHKFLHQLKTIKKFYRATLKDYHQCC